MAIADIARDKCDGCAMCLDSCPDDVIRLDEEGKAIIRYLEDCHTCFLCEMYCPPGAIYVSPEVLEVPLPY